MKGLRQANNRIKKHGYSSTFHDPAHLDPALAKELASLMGLSRRGEHERGFSMMLGRIFDPRDTGLLLTVVHGPDGRPAAMCQFVPAAGIRGYSLDLMRRDPCDHPNGLLDFALCSTIEHLKTEGYEGLSLNFATMRSTLSGDRGDGTVQRAERWFLKRLSSFAQIEIPLAIQRQVRARMASSLRRLRHGRAPGTGAHGHRPGRVDVGDSRTRQVAGSGSGETHPGRPARCR